MERNIKLTLAYDGTDFSGFQRQKNTSRTIQEKLEKALNVITGEKVAVIGAGRTDAGVHAAAQVVNFRTQSTIPTEKWPFALRGLLPKTIIVYRAEEVAWDFHARLSAKAKTYLYRIWRAAWPSVFQQRFTYHYPEDLNEENIRSVLPLFIGEHDFGAFAATGSETSNSIRIISRLELEPKGDEWLIWIKANGFLYHMVRIIVGTLLWVGGGKLTEQDVYDALTVNSKAKVGPTVPASGLSLMEVEY